MTILEVREPVYVAELLYAVIKCSRTNFFTTYFEAGTSNRDLYVGVIILFQSLGSRQLEVKSL